MASPSQGNWATTMHSSASAIVSAQTVRPLSPRSKSYHGRRDREGWLALLLIDGALASVA